MQGKRAIAVQVALGLLVLLSMGLASAGERTLEFQLVTKYLDVRTMDAANVDGQSVSQGKAFGVAVFKDGKIGTKEFVFARDGHKDGGSYYGYSTYTFEDGSVTARYVGSYDSQHSHCDYTILSGTGTYASARGTGTCDSVPNPFKDIGLYKVKLKITTP
jgi:hypothetical protein